MKCMLRNMPHNNLVSKKWFLVYIEARTLHVDMAGMVENMTITRSKCGNDGVLARDLGG